MKLLPCPFCGGEAEGDGQRGFVNYKGQHGNAVAVYCTACEAEFSMCYDDFPEYTVEHLMEMVTDLWNRRVQEPIIKEAHALLNSKEVAWTAHPGPWRDARDRWNESVKGLIK